MSEVDPLGQPSVFLPSYLTSGDQAEVLQQLREFPYNRPFYSQPSPTDIVLQGDGWQGFQVTNSSTHERRQVTGIVLSNSCDISTSNTAYRNRRIVFAPLIPLHRYASRLEGAGMEQIARDAHLHAVQRQEVTYIFYLPAITDLMPESIVLLDDIHTHPVGTFMEHGPNLLFRLHQFSFWLFLMKLSIHFCRMQERVRRFDPVQIL